MERIPLLPPKTPKSNKHGLKGWNVQLFICRLQKETYQYVNKGWKHFCVPSVTHTQTPNRFVLSHVPVMFNLLVFFYRSSAVCVGEASAQNLQRWIKNRKFSACWWKSGQDLFTRLSSASSVRRSGVSALSKRFRPAGAANAAANASTMQPEASLHGNELMGEQCSYTSHRLSVRIKVNVQTKETWLSGRATTPLTHETNRRSDRNSAVRLEGETSDQWNMKSTITSVVFQKKKLHNYKKKGFVFVRLQRLFHMIWSDFKGRVRFCDDPVPAVDTEHSAPCRPHPHV